jgi:uncharacterized protein YdaT
MMTRGAAAKRKNWVAQEGNLPPFIDEVADALMRDEGFTRERAIATAVSRVRVWAAKGNAKAVKALAQWEALKAKAHARPNKG